MKTIRIKHPAISIALLSGLCAFGALAQSRVEVMIAQNGIRIEEPGTQRAMNCLPLEDGSFLIVGMEDTSDKKGEFLLMRLDKNLKLVWRKTWGDAGVDFPFSIIRSKDGNFLMVGFTTTADKGLDAWVCKINEAGEILWSRSWGGPGDERAVSITATTDGNYAIAGQTSEDGRVKGMVAKISEQGELLWTRSYSFTAIDRFFGIAEVSHGDLFVSGLSNANYPDNADVLMVRIGPTGELLWQKQVGSARGDIAHALIKGRKNSMYLVGYTGELAGSLSDPMIMHVSENGLVIDKTVLQTGIEARIMYGYINQDGHKLYCSGYIRDSLDAPWDPLLIEFDLKKGKHNLSRVKVPESSGELFGIGPNGKSGSLGIGHAVGGNFGSDVLLVKWNHRMEK